MERKVRNIQFHVKNIYDILENEGWRNRKRILI